MENNLNTTNKLPIIDQAVWCLQGFASMLPWIICAYYLLYFYTDVMGISAALAGTLMFGARMFDAVTDILIGWCVDNLHFRWGKYRSWVLFSIFSNAITWPLCWVALDGAPLAVNLAIALVGYGLQGAVSQTLYYIPTCCQIIPMTKDEGKRASLISIKSVCQNVGILTAASIYYKIVEALGMTRSAWLIAALIVAVPYLFLLWADFAVFKKYELTPDGKWNPELEMEANAEGKVERVKLGTQLKQLCMNRPAVITVIGILILNFVSTFRNSSTIYCLNYYFDAPDMMGATVFWYQAATIVGALVMMPAVKIFKGSNRAYIAWCFLTAASFIIFYFMGVGMDAAAAKESIHYGMLFWLYILGGFFTGAYANFNLLLLTMSCDYGLWKYGRDQSGLVFSLNGFMLTAATALAGLVFGIVLTSIGYDEASEAEVVAESVRSGLFFWSVMAPSIMTIVHAVVQMFLGVSEKEYKEVIVPELAKRNEEKLAAAAAKDAE